MAVCESCGARVADGTTICPECGHPVVRMKTSLGLKGENGRKPIKQTAFTPTDNYGDIYDGNSVGGTEPVKITKDNIKEYKESTRRSSGGSRGASGIGKLFGTLFKFLIFAAFVFGVYLFVTKVVLKPDGPQTYEEAVDTFQAAVNSHDSEQVLELVPDYITANKALVEEMMPYIEETEYTTVSIISVEQWEESEVDDFNDKIQLTHGQTANAKDGVTIKLGLRGTMKDTNGIKRQYMEVSIDFVKMKGSWYPDIEEVQELLFMEK